MQNTYIQKAADAKSDKEAIKEYRNALLAKAKADKVGIVHIFDAFDTKGGLTVAFQKSNEYKSGVMVTVAVNVCSKDDTFSRSIGTTGALDKFFDGQNIELPLLSGWLPEDLSMAVKYSFTKFYAAM